LSFDFVSSEIVERMGNCTFDVSCVSDSSTYERDGVDNAPRLAWDFLLALSDGFSSIANGILSVDDLFEEGREAY
jgi:hypothetical protein